MRWRVQYSLRTVLLFFIPVAFLTSLVVWLFFPPPVNVAMTVEGTSWFETGDENGNLIQVLGVRVLARNRSRHTVWYLEDPRYYLFEYIDGQWRESWTGTVVSGTAKKEPWSALAGLQSVDTVVGLAEKTTAIKLGMAFTTDHFRRQVHWVFTPTVKVTKQGQDYSLETLPPNAEDETLESKFTK